MLNRKYLVNEYVKRETLSLYYKTPVNPMNKYLRRFGNTFLMDETYEVFGTRVMNNEELNRFLSN